MSDDQSRAAASPEFLIHPDKCGRSYMPNYNWGSEWLSDRHRRIADAVWDIPGWLSEEDSQKLYELAYFADGPILEIGTYCGRSTVIMATAIADRGARGYLVSLDIDGQMLALAQRFIRKHGVQEHVLLVSDSIDKFLRSSPKFRPNLVFIDGDHSAADVEADLEWLAHGVNSGTVMIFHDYVPSSLPVTDGFGVSPEPIEVAQAVNDSWVPSFTEFAGTFGCSAVFMVSAPPPDL